VRPVSPDIPWEEKDFVDKALAQRVVGLIRSTVPDVTPEVLFETVVARRKQLYEESVAKFRSSMGLPYAQWHTWALVCKTFGVDIAQCNKAAPQVLEAPADFASITFYLSQREALAEATRERARKSLEQNSRNRASAAAVNSKTKQKGKTEVQTSLPATSPLPAPSDGKSTGLASSRWATESTGGKHTAVTPATETADKQTARLSTAVKASMEQFQTHQVSLADIWEEHSSVRTPPPSPLLALWDDRSWPPDWLEPFDIPFHPERDWEFCVGTFFEDGLAQYVPPSVTVRQVTYPAIHNSSKFVVEFAAGVDGTLSYNKNALLLCWMDLSTWSNDLIEIDIGVEGVFRR